MRYILVLLLFFNFLFSLDFTPKEKQFLKDNPVIYMAAMKYWPVDKEGESLHTNYMKLLNKYGHLNLQPVYYKHWSDGFNDAKEGITYGIMALSYSKKREKWFYYTKPYNYTPYYLIVNKNSDIKSMDDLNNKKVFIAKNSILREVLKNTPFDIVYIKNAYKALANKKIDAVLLFYIPKTKYIKDFRIIKTFINKAGEEHIGINKKYPELYSIITKVMKVIPFDEIEKIRALPYEKRVVATSVLTPNIKFTDLVSKEDLIFILLLLSALGIILYLFFTKRFLSFNIKSFLISIFVFDIFVLGFIVYEILVFNYYSNKILELKSKSFNALYLTDNIEKSVMDLHQTFIRKFNKHKGDVNKLFDNEYPVFANLLVNNQPVKNFLVIKNFTQTELSNLLYIQKLTDELIQIQNQVLNNKISFVIYRQKYLSLIDMFKRLKTVIRNENQREIFVIKDKVRYQFLLLIFSVLLFIIESIFIFIMIKKKIYNPIYYLTNVIKEFKKGKKVKKEISFNDEIGILIEEFFSLQEKLHQQFEELKKHKENLEVEVKNEVEKRLYQEQILVQQSRMAVMGEMIDAIAHQWKQPLNTISLAAQLIDLEKEEINIDKKLMKDVVENISMQVKHMVETLDEFRSFFRDNKEKEKICMKNIVKKVLLLLKDELLKNNINVNIQIEKDFCIDGIKNQFEHLVLTIITNAKDIFNEREIEKREIIIQTKEDEVYYYLEIIDNAGGIDNHVLNKIFELNFTTRKTGTGVGLYLANQIATKHMGSLDVENTQNGAKFYFKVRKDV